MLEQNPKKYLDLIKLLSVFNQPNPKLVLDSEQHTLFLQELLNCFAKNKNLCEQINKLIQLYGENINGLYESLNNFIRPFLTEFNYHLLGEISQIKQKTSKEDEKHLKKQKIYLNFLIKKTVDNHNDHLKNQLSQASNQEFKSLSQLRSLIEARINLIKQWGGYLSSFDKSIDLSFIDCAGVDFSGLDVRNVIFPKNGLGSANLLNIQCNSEQFLHVRGLDQIKIDTELLKAIKEMKIKHVNATVIRVCVIELEDMKNKLKSVELLSRLICNGKEPKLNDLSRNELAQLAEWAMLSSSINALPKSHPCNQQSLSEKNDPFKDLGREELIKCLDEMLCARKRTLSSEVIAHVQPTKISLVFEQMKIDEVRELQSDNEDLPEGIKIKNKGLIEEYLNYVKELKNNKQELLRKYHQNSINQFIICLFEEPDKQLGFTLAYRLQMSLNSARHHDDLFVDLTQVKLNKLDLNKIENLNFSHVWVKLTAEQEQMLPDIFLAQRYARLFKAIKANDLKELNICLLQGLDINFVDKNTGRTPFMTACVESSAETVEYLLKNGADPKIKTNSNWRIIEPVARLYRHDIVEILIKYGEKLDFMSAVYLANGPKDLENFDIEEIKKNIHEKDHSSNLPLHIAIDKQCLPLVQWLIEQGADVNAKNRSNKTSLEMAIEKGNLEIINALLKTNKITITEETVLFAFEQQQNEIALLLRKQLKTIENPALAIYLDEVHGNNKVKELLLKNINGLLLPKKNWTPLALACVLGKLDIIEWLLSNKADINGVCQGETPLGHAVATGQGQAVKHLIEKGALLNEIIKNTTPPLFIAARDGNVEMVKLLLSLKNKSKLDINQKYLGRTVLFAAVQNNRPSVVKLLLEAGCDPCEEDLNKNKALHIASSLGNEECIVLLTGAMLNTKNLDKKTPQDLVPHEKKDKILPLFQIGQEKLPEETIIFTPVKNKRGSYGEFFLEKKEIIVIENNNINIISENNNSGSFKVDYDIKLN